MKLSFFPASGMWPYDQYFCDDSKPPPQPNYADDYLSSGYEGGQDRIYTIDPYKDEQFWGASESFGWGASKKFTNKEECQGYHVFSQVSSISTCCSIVGL